MALISIIVPVYNVEKYLRKCMESLVNQTLRDIEIICVNDGSTDSSRLILEEYKRLDNRIVIVEKENGGLSSARNEGLKYISGEYLMFVDSDDWIDVDTCSSVWTIAKKHNADLILWSYVREFPSSSREKYMFWNDEEIFDKDLVKMGLQRQLVGLIGKELRHPDYGNALETAWGKLYRSERILKNQIEFMDTSEIGTEDALFNIYAMEYIEKAVYLKKCYYHYRKDNITSLTSKYKDRLFEQWQYLFDLIYQYIEKKQLPDIFKSALENRIALSLIGLGLNIASSRATADVKMKRIKQILENDRYVKVFKNLKLHFMPLHWKIFFWCAKMKNQWAIYCLLNIMQKLIQR